jgi:hypothetical protein
MMEHYVEKHTATLVLDARATLGEGALWCPRERVLYWVDIEGKKLHRFDPATRRDRWLAMPVMVSSVVPVAEGGLLLSLEHSIIRLHWSLGSYHVLASVEPDQPGNRCNDGKCDPAGRYWIGTMHLESEEGAGSLYCFTPSLTVAKKRGGVTISNGLAWSADHRRMYYIDTPTGQVQIRPSTTKPALWVKYWGPFPFRRPPVFPTAWPSTGGQPVGCLVGRLRGGLLGPNHRPVDPQGGSAGPPRYVLRLRRQRPADAVHHHGPVGADGGATGAVPAERRPVCRTHRRAGPAAQLFCGSGTAGKHPAQTGKSHRHPMNRLISTHYPQFPAE